MDCGRRWFRSLLVVRKEVGGMAIKSVLTVVILSQDSQTVDNWKAWIVEGRNSQVCESWQFDVWIAE